MTPSEREAFFALGYRWVNVVCSHAGQPSGGRLKKLERIRWQETDPEELEAFTAGARQSGISAEALEAILLNDRFVTYVARTDAASGAEADPEARAESVRTFRVGTASGDEIIQEAGALGRWGFRCACGVDRPVRQSSMDRWIRGEIAAQPDRHTFTFDISESQFGGRSTT